jgi:hypothetical protein
MRETSKLETPCHVLLHYHTNATAYVCTAEVPADEFKYINAWSPA